MVRSERGRRIGIFGGTFDPPHIGHLVAAVDAQRELGLDVVLLVVANVPWQKVGQRRISPAEDRIALVHAAVEDAPFLQVSDIEIRRGGPSYTADTLAELRRAEPTAELFVILGNDAAAGFATWERFEEVVEQSTLVVVDRPGVPTPVDPRFDWVRVDTPELEISSTEIRAAVSRPAGPFGTSRLQGSRPPSPAVPSIVDPMTSETPPPSRRSRPGADVCRRALGLDAGGGEAPVPEVALPGSGAAPTATARRETLRDSLSRIPDLTADDPLLALSPVVPVDSLPVEAAPVRPEPKAAEPSRPPKAGRAPSPRAPAAKTANGAATGGTTATADSTGSASAATGRTTGADGRSAGAEVNGAAPAAVAAVAFRSPTAPPAAAPARYAGLTGADPLASTATAGDGSSSQAPAVRVPKNGRARPPMWRRVAFAIVLLGLIASIPVLGYAGYHLISESKDGEYTGATLSPSDPGYEAPVDPTPTAVAIQYDDQRMPTGVTFLSLAGGEGGGSVIFVPLDTEVTEPSFGVDRLRTAYEVVADRPNLARERLASQVGRLVNVGVDEIIDLDNAGWEQLVTPVGPLIIDNPDEVDLGFGQVIPSGTATLTAAQVGPFLAASIEGESDLNRLARHEAVWTAWLEQLEASGKAEAVPGESSAGISKFAKTLASGPVTFDTLPVNSVPGLTPMFKADKDAVNQLITDNVASPTAAVPGSRFTVRLLNGVSPDGIPSDLVRQIVGRGGAVTVLGNGPQFGTDETTVVYANPADKDVATLIASSLGATGKVRLDREAPDTVDLTIVLGKDVLGDATGSGTPGSTTPATTTSGGN